MTKDRFSFLPSHTDTRAAREREGQFAGEDGLLLLQIRPRNIGYHVAGSVNQPDVCGLHQHVHEDNFKVAFVLTARYVVAVFRHDHLGPN
jgi:hypothetical protein